MNIDLNNTYWDRLKGFVSEHRVDARWVLRENKTDSPLGSLRIVSHPDLPPGYLRATFIYITDVREKTQQEKFKSTEDYQMELEELEVYSVRDDIKTNSKEFKEPYQTLEEIFNVKIFK
jgi:hypothetical protein